MIYWHGDKSLTFYEAEFETHYLTAVREEYDRKAQRWVTTENAREYLVHVDNSLQHEEDIADYLLESETKPKLLKRVE
jgi:hypothetical protein